MLLRADLDPPLGKPKEELVCINKNTKEILNFIDRFIQTNGYSPTLEEIGEHFGYTSLATVHKHLTHLKEKKLIPANIIQADPWAHSCWIRNRWIWSSPSWIRCSGSTIEAITIDEVISVPADMVKTRGRNLRVASARKFNDRWTNSRWWLRNGRRPQAAENGEMVIALIDGEEATLKKNFIGGAAEWSGYNRQIQTWNRWVISRIGSQFRHCDRNIKEILIQYGVPSTENEYRTSYSVLVLIARYWMGS